MPWNPAYGNRCLATMDTVVAAAVAGGAGGLSGGSGGSSGCGLVSARAATRVAYTHAITRARPRATSDLKLARLNQYTTSTTRIPRSCCQPRRLGPTSDSHQAEADTGACVQPVAGGRRVTDTDPELPEGFKEIQPRGTWNGRFKWEATRMKTKLVNPPCLSKTFTFGSAPGDREAMLNEVKKWYDAGRPAGPWPKKELGERR
ncbi:hypothetical protein TSOC_008703 [Tetrabaena socialis]|uniref:Uncharacterized protein n=1 Tax=Tetrabaena socialis TaxID=47790 RepID=A0A2J7ZXT1_9CHLO|nr:hypothetical protein TSOC_008703 [Tetrabaena socialis]|eukprot:PNH05074.1 hypothetical protein TSOC_008703 [Tetrabaena socialis]